MRPTSDGYSSAVLHVVQPACFSIEVQSLPFQTRSELQLRFDCSETQLPSHPCFCSSYVEFSPSAFSDLFLCLYGLHRNDFSLRSCESAQRVVLGSRRHEGLGKLFGRLRGNGQDAEYGSTSIARNVVHQCPLRVPQVRALARSDHDWPSPVYDRLV